MSPPLRLSVKHCMQKTIRFLDLGSDERVAFIFLGGGTLKHWVNENYLRALNRKRAARTVLTGMCYSVGSATRQGSSSPTRFIGQSAMTSRT